MKQKVTTTNFSSVVTSEGTLYLEKRPKGKWLCFRKGHIVKTLKLTKKSYQNLNRFAVGSKTERYIEMEMDYDQDDCCDVWYNKWHQNLPVVVPTKVKEKSPFIMQMFIYKP